MVSRSAAIENAFDASLSFILPMIGDWSTHSFYIQNNENLHSPLSSFFWHVQKGTSFASVINQYLSEALRTLSDQDAESFAHCFTLNESSHYGGSDCVSAITKVGLACFLHHSTSTDSVHVFPDQIRTYIPWRFTFLGLRKWCSPTLLP